MWRYFILRPGENFRIEADILDPWSYIWVGFRTSLILPELYLQDVFPAKNLENLFLEIANCNKLENRPLEPLLLSYIWKLIFRLKQFNTISNKKYTNVRLQAARNLLLQNYTVTETSTMVGYADIASFSRAFKAYYKFSPTQYVQLNTQSLTPDATDATQIS